MIARNQLMKQPVFHTRYLSQLNLLDEFHNLRDGLMTFRNYCIRLIMLLLFSTNKFRTHGWNDFIHLRRMKWDKFS